MDEDHCSRKTIIDDRDHKLVLETEIVLEKLYPEKFPKLITLKVETTPLSELKEEVKDNDKYSFKAEVSTKKHKHEIEGKLYLNNTKDICYCGYHVAQQIATMIALPINRPYKISKDHDNEPYTAHQPYPKTLNPGKYYAIAYAAVPLEDQDIDPQYDYNTRVHTAYYIYCLEAPPENTDNYEQCSTWWKNITEKNHTLADDMATIERHSRSIEKMFTDLSIVDVIQNPTTPADSVLHKFFDCFTHRQKDALAFMLYETHFGIFNQILDDPYVMTSDVIIELFLTSNKIAVRGALAGNYNMPKHYLERLVKDKDLLVSSRASAIYNMKYNE